MTAFIIKSGLCMVFLFGLYWLVLRKGKQFIFNRCYLISSLLFSLAVPFVSLPVDIGSGNVTNALVSIINHEPGSGQILYAKGTDNENPRSTDINEIYPVSKPLLISTNPGHGSIILLIIYLSGLILMIIRFCRNIFIVYNMINQSGKVDLGLYKVALSDDPITPFSFMRTVFLNKQAYIEDRIPANVLRHEIEHIRQSHSYDVIFFEIMNIAFWFNPVLYFYKWAARINHEYLADEAVIRGSSDIETYAGELINFISLRSGVPFTCGITSSLIRKRLMMLNTSNSRSDRNIRLAVTLTLSVVLLTCLSLKPVYSGTRNEKIKKQVAETDDIITEEVYFRDSGFKPMKARLIINGQSFGLNDTIRIDPKTIKTITVLTGRKSLRKYGRDAINGVVELCTYGFDKNSAPDSSRFKPIYTVNNKVPEGSLTIPFSNLFSVSMWTYPLFPVQDPRRQWRTIDIMTRDYYVIRGKVIQKNGDPLPGVLVTTTDNASGVTTGKDGKFLLEDVRAGAVAKISAEGHEPLFFTVKGIVFTSYLTLTPDKINEKKNSIIWTNHEIADFSGRWRFNEDLSRSLFPITDYLLEIIQYDSDSILVSTSETFENSKEMSRNSRFSFNTVRNEESSLQNNTTSMFICSIGPDKQSFSVTYSLKSKLGLFKENRRTITYSLSNDEKQLFIRTFDTTDTDPVAEREVEALVLDRI